MLASTLFYGPFHTNLSPAHAETHSGVTFTKKRNIDERELLRIVGEDITIRQALVTADFTRALYDENCKFQTDLDTSTYTFEKYAQIAKGLFNGQKSLVGLAGPVKLDKTRNIISYPFIEKLTFNFFLSPCVYVTGRVELTRASYSGLIVYSREIWYESPNDVFDHIRF